MFYLTPYLFALVGPMIVQVLAAVIPAVILIVLIYRKDTVEKEPPGLIVSLIALGVVSTFFAMATETIGQLLLSPQAYAAPLLHSILMYFIVVGLSEEGFKHLLLRLRTWKHPAFNYRFDAVVYAVCVSLGFALFENIQYVMQFGMATAAVRAVTAVPGHACFGVLMGVWYGEAKMCEARGDRAGMVRNRLLSLIIPVFAHGLYDFIATLGGGVTVIFIVFVIAMFVIALRLVRAQSASDRPIGGGPGPWQNAGRPGGYNGQNGPGGFGGQSGYGPNGPDRSDPNRRY